MSRVSHPNQFIGDSATCKLNRIFITKTWFCLTTCLWYIFRLVDRVPMWKSQDILRHDIGNIIEPKWSWVGPIARLDDGGIRMLADMCYRNVLVQRPAARFAGVEMKIVGRKWIRLGQDRNGRHRQREAYAHVRRLIWIW